MEASDLTEERLRAICASVGLDLDHVSASIVSRMQLLAAHTETVADAVHMAEFAEEIFRYYDSKKPTEAFSATERRTVVLGCLFSDVGKTGPADADEDGQRLIVDMFSVEGVPDESQPVERFLKTYFPDDAEARVERFERLGLDPSMSIRAFWNLHSGWTLEIVEAAGVPPEAVAAAATHHFLDDINPEAVVGPDHHFTRAFGENTTFDRTEKLVILLDKYDAARRRGHLTHARAVAWLRERVRASARFHGDHELSVLISDLDEVVRVHGGGASIR
jgi:hypothetical protein